MNSELTARLGTFFDGRRVLPVGSGTAGLALVLRALGVQGKRVLMPALVCPNVAVAVRAAGGIPCLVDQSPQTYDLSPAALESALDDSVGAVVAVDAFGYPADIEALEEVARPYSCPIVEDACQGYGGRVGGRALGARGTASVVSFGYAKSLELVGGGLVTTGSKELFEEMRGIAEARWSRRLAGLKNKVSARLMLAGRYRRMEQWAGRFGLLEYGFPRGLARELPGAWDAWVARLDALMVAWRCVAERLASFPGVEPFRYEQEGWLPWRYSFKAADPADRDELQARLKARGIRTSKLYGPVSESLEVEERGPCRGARSLCTRTLNLSYRTLEEVSALAGRLAAADR